MSAVFSADGVSVLIGSDEKYSKDVGLRQRRIQKFPIFMITYYMGIANSIVGAWNFQFDIGIANSTVGAKNLFHDKILV